MPTPASSPAQSSQPCDPSQTTASREPCRNIRQLPSELIYKIFDYSKLRSQRIGIVVTLKDATKHEILFTIMNCKADESFGESRGGMKAESLLEAAMPSLPTANGVSLSQVGGNLSVLYEAWSTEKRDVEVEHATEVRNLARLLVASIDSPKNSYDVQIRAHKLASGGWQVRLSGRLRGPFLRPARDGGLRDDHMVEIDQSCYLLGTEDCTRTATKPGVVSGQLKHWLSRWGESSRHPSYVRLDADATARKLERARVEFIHHHELAAPLPALSLVLW